jgi:hypothetical protein
MRVKKPAAILIGPDRLRQEFPDVWKICPGRTQASPGTKGPASSAIFFMFCKSRIDSMLRAQCRKRLMRGTPIAFYPAKVMIFLN